MNELPENNNELKSNNNNINLVHGATESDFKFFEYLNKDYDYAQKKVSLEANKHFDKDEKPLNNFNDTSIAGYLNT